MSITATVANTMYTLAKKLGWWTVTLESNPEAVQFRSLSRRTASNWKDANEVADVWSARPA